MSATAALSPLVRALDDSEGDVRHNAAFALQLLALDAVDAADRARAARATREAATRLLARRGTASDPALVIALGWTGTAAAVHALKPLLEGPRRRAALVAWGLLGRRGQVDAASGAFLLPALASKDVETRRLASWAASQLTRKTAGALREPLLRVARDDPDPRVRTWATRALRGARVKPEWWLARLRDPSHRVQIEAARRLAALGTWPAVKLSVGLARRWRSVASNHYRLTGAPLHAVLVGLRVLRRHAHVPTIQRFAKQMLESSDATGAAVSYSPTEKHSIDLVHCAVAQLRDRGLGRTERTPTCGTAKADHLGSTWRRRQVVEVIGELKRSAEEKLLLLRRYLQSADPAVRAAAVDALGAIDARAIRPALVKALADDDAAVFATAAATTARRAARLRGAGFEQPLIRRLAALNHIARPRVSCQAIGALQRLRARAALPLLQRLHRRAPAWAVRRCASTAIAGLARAEPAPASPPSRGEPDLRWAGREPLPRRAVLVTRKGEVFLELLADEAPATVAAFARLARQRGYRGSAIEQVQPNGLLTAGGARLDRFGDAPLTVPCELTPRPFRRGSVALFSEGRDTGARRFVIGLLRRPQLDGRLTQFARVVKGMEVVDRLHVGERIKDLYLPRGPDKGKNDEKKPPRRSR